MYPAILLSAGVTSTLFVVDRAPTGNVSYTSSPVWGLNFRFAFSANAELAPKATAARVTTKARKKR